MHNVRIRVRAEKSQVIKFHQLWFFKSRQPSMLHAPPKNGGYIVYSSISPSFRINTNLFEAERMQYNQPSPSRPTPYHLSVSPWFSLLLTRSDWLVITLVCPHQFVSVCVSVCTPIWWYRMRYSAFSIQSIVNWNNLSEKYKHWNERILVSVDISFRWKNANAIVIAARSAHQKKKKTRVHRIKHVVVVDHSIHLVIVFIFSLLFVFLFR